MEKAKADKGFLKELGKYETYKISYDYKLRDTQKDYPFEIRFFVSEDISILQGLRNIKRRPVRGL